MRTTQTSHIKLLIFLGLSISSTAGAQCPETLPTDNRYGNAGCLITRDNKVLVLRHMPSGKIDLPSGRAKPREPAQCTAHRETLEETGLDLEVGDLLGEFNSGFLLYSCQSADGIYPDPLKVPLSARLEVLQLFWAELKGMDKNDWRFPSQLEEIRRHIRRHKREAKKNSTQ
ncbi:MAG: NUDIX hydrolase [Gammaproteobacteria bacterium]